MKTKRVPFHLRDAEKVELDWLKSKRLNKKLETCDEGRIISAIVITCKKDKTFNKQIYMNKFQLPNIHELY